MRRRGSLTYHFPTCQIGVQSSKLFVRTTTILVVLTNLTSASPLPLTPDICKPMLSPWFGEVPGGPRGHKETPGGPNLKGGKGEVNDG